MKTLLIIHVIGVFITFCVAWKTENTNTKQGVENVVSISLLWEFCVPIIILLWITKITIDIPTKIIWNIKNKNKR